MFCYAANNFVLKILPHEFVPIVNIRIIIGRFDATCHFKQTTSFMDHPHTVLVLLIAGHVAGICTEEVIVSYL
jgi:hypothetical protein